MLETIRRTDNEFQSAVETPAQHSGPDLDSLLAPHDRQEFLREYYGARPLHVAGCQGRFRTLFHWEALNDLLEHLDLKSTRIHVLKDGASIAPELFSVSRSGSAPVLSTPFLTGYLRGGAILAIEGVDELHGPITRLARYLERDLRVSVKVNVIAGFCTPRIRSSHWDMEHSFKLQIAGKTKWEITGPTYGYPPVERNLQTMSIPDNEPVWQGGLQEGDVLYIPRGWWYVGAPCGEPSIHLSIAFSSATGRNVLSWLGQDLNEAVCMRRDVPRFTDESAQASYLKEFRDAVLGAIDAQGFLGRFWEHADSQSQIRPSFSLPASATSGVLPDSDGHIDLLAPTGLEVRPVAGEEAVEIRSAGINARFHPAAAPLLSYLSDHDGVTLSRFRTDFGEWFAPSQLDDFLRNLADHGLIAIKEVPK